MTLARLLARANEFYAAEVGHAVESPRIDDPQVIALARAVAEAITPRTHDKFDTSDVRIFRGEF